MRTVITHIPHSSVLYPELMSHPELMSDILLLTDLYTDELFEHSNTQPLIAKYTRFYVDMERYLTNDVMEKVGMGWFYTHLINGKQFRDKTDSVFAEKYYHDHHNKLKQLVETGTNPIIIDCHSFSNIPLACDQNQQQDRPDFCIGHNNDDTAPLELIKQWEQFLHSKGYSVSINEPYSGSMTALTNKPHQSVMIEVNKKLYLKNQSIEKSLDFNNTKSIIKQMIDFVLI